MLRKIYFIVFIFSAFAQQVYSQAATATWTSTANGNVVTTGNITATGHTFSSGLTTTGYNTTYGAQAVNWGGSQCAPTGTRFYEYTISPSGCNDFRVTQVTFIGRSSGTGRCWQLYYSIDGGAESQLGSNFIMTNSNTNYNFSTGAVSVDVLQGQTITFHLYGSGSTASTLGARSFAVTGTTTNVLSAPSVSISANPGSTICTGNSVTYTATPTLGGTTPSYQWKLNGGNVGSNSPNYTNAGLVNGDQVWCVMTSNSPCASPTSATSNIITMTVNGIPNAPGTISGPPSVGPGSTGLAYSIAAVAGATSYNWNLPTGWSITGGAGTVAITATSGAIGQNGNITVSASNACGTSGLSSIAVTIVPPHNVCNGCHINHTAPGVAITGVNGNANLCISCHTSGNPAASKPIDNSMKAIPGTSGTSHQWDKPSINGTYQTNKTTNSDMLLRLPGDSIICSTCHNQHTSGVMPKFLRISNNEDALCLQCHTARNIGTYAQSSANKGSHPIGVVYNTGDSRFQAMSLPLSTSNKVWCSSCHSPHYSASSDGNLLRDASKDNLCALCHTYKAYSISLDHEGMTCTTCHYGHENGSGNIYLIRSSINTPNSGSKTVSFTADASGSNFADGVAGYNGVCEVCHTLTDHYKNTGNGMGAPRHPNNPVAKCVNCHPHNQAFYPVKNCLDCHNSTQGTRRQIVDANADGTGLGGDFKRNSHHVTGSIPNVNDCVKCHYMGDHKGGSVKLFDPDLGYNNIITYNPADKSSVETFCLKCHDDNGANGDITPFSDGVTVPVVDATLWVASAHKGAAATNTCLNCHDNGHGSNKSNLLGPYAFAGSGTPPADVMDEEEDFCFQCHGSTTTTGLDVHLAFSSYTNTTTNFYKHDPAATYRVHTSGETAASSFGGTNRHVECVDCHNPHGAVAGTATAPTLLPTLIGATGVEPTYAGAGPPTGFTWQSSVSQEYQVCFKCHSSFTTLPTYQPAGWGTAIVANGLGKITYINAGQVNDSRDMAREYNPSNNSFHPVMAVGKNTPINSASFVAPWTASSLMYCSDCHTHPTGATNYGRGPHGSNLLHILPGTTNYKTVESSAANTEVCSKCHQSNVYITSSSNATRFYDVSGTPGQGKGNLHDYHNGQSCSCYMCHDSHGSEIDHLFNFNYSISGHSYMSPATNSQNMLLPNNSPHACLLNCHTSHGTGSKTWWPSY